MSRESWPRLATATLVLLFFLQALRALFSTVFGILYDQIFAGSPTAWLPVSLLLVVLSMAAPFVADSRRIRQRGAWQAGLVVVACLARIPMTLNDADVRFAASLVVVAAGGSYLATQLRGDPRRVWSACALALAADQLLRIAGETYDLSLQSSFLLPLILLAVAAAAFSAVGADEAPPQDDRNLGAPVAFGAWLFLETSLLSVANATARWSGWPYEWLAPVTLGLTVLCLLPVMADSVARTWMRPTLQVALPLGLILGTSVGGIVAAFGLMAAHVSALLSLRAWTDGSHRPRHAGAAVAWGTGFFLLLNILLAFTFTYPYTLPFLRGLGWAVYLVAALAAGFPLLRPVAEPAARLRVSAGAVAGGAAAVLLATVLVWPRTPDDQVDVRALRLATYNIHYGYDETWGFNLAEQAEAIRGEGVDLIALQEVDTGRMTSYMADDAYFLARKLGMRQAYLPTVEHLTGIAVLYRGSSVQIERVLVTSRQEQTGVVHVHADMGGRPFHMFGLWLGLSDEDTQRQIEEGLTFVGDRTPAALGGDFNSKPESTVYEAVTRAGLLDPFTTLDIDPAPPTSPAVHPEERIDYVFLRGVAPRQAWVSDSLTSDHRMVVVEVDLTLPPLPDVVSR